MCEHEYEEQLHAMDYRTIEGYMVVKGDSVLVSTCKHCGDTFDEIVTCGVVYGT